MDDLEFIIAVSIVLAVVGGFIFPAIIIETQYPANPAKWRSERRRRVEMAQVRRISTLEHDLGYVPCSDDDCSICARTIFMDNGRKYVMKSSTPPSTKSLKKAKKNRRAPARKAV